MIVYNNHRVKLAIAAAVLTICLLFTLSASHYGPWDRTDIARFGQLHFGGEPQDLSALDGINLNSNSTEGSELKSKKIKKTKKIKSTKHGKSSNPKKPSGKHVKTQSPMVNKRPKVNPGGSKMAYVTWFSGDSKMDKPLEDDQYFIATRILIWQLLHNPSTRTNGIDVVVMVDPTIDSRRRERLAKDGAIIYPVEFLTGTVDLHPSRVTWRNIMTKLRVFEMTQYERILVLDGDSMLLHPLDGVFDDPAAQLQGTGTHKDEDGHPPMPSTYLLAGLSEIHDSNHDFPPAKKDIKTPGYMNAGFFVCAPSKEMFEYYRSFLIVEDTRFNSEYMEQNLLRTVHGWDGPMPWKELDYKWNIREPNENDFEKGVVSVHEKYWDHGTIHGNQKVVDWLESRRWEMKGWYDAYDQLFDD